MFPEPAATPVTESVTWRDAIVRQLVRSDRGRSAAWLADIDAHDAALFLRDPPVALVLVAWPSVRGAGLVLRERLKHIVDGSRRNLHVAVLGGGDEGRALVEEFQAQQSRETRVALHHVSENGALWNGATALRPLARALSQIAKAIEQGEALRGLSDVELTAAREECRRIATAEEVAARLARQRRPPATIVLLAAIVGFYVLETLWGGPDAPGTLFRMGAADRSAFLSGQWWRLVTPAFLHGGPAHILANAWSLWALGVMLEPLLGTARFLVLYTSSAVVAALASMFLGSGLSVGASGAIFGLMGGLVGLALFPRGRLPPTIAGRLQRGLWPPLLINAYISFTPGIDWHAHAGGGLTGFLLVASGLLTLGVPSMEAREHESLRSPIWTGAAALSAGVMTAACAVGALHGRPWDRNPGPPRHVSIRGTRLSLDLPAELAASARFEELQNHVIATFGQLGATELVVSVELIPEPDEDQPPPESQGAALLATAVHAHAAGFAETKPAQIAHSPSGAVVSFAEAGHDGLERTVWLSFRHEGLVVVSAGALPQTGAPWRVAAAGLIDTLKD